jgi:deferrochelatase/peroxidase EfeB
MSHALVTITAPLALANLAAAEAAIDALGNPCGSALADQLDRLDVIPGALPSRPELGTHFMSLHAFASHEPDRAFLLFEFSADGTEEQALVRIVDRIGDSLRSVFMLASDWKDGGDLLAYLGARKVRIGGGWDDNPGVAFAGTPGLSVGRIRDEALLAERCASLLIDIGGDRSSLARLQAVRDALNTPEFSAMLRPAEAALPWKARSIPSLIVPLLASFVSTYLWPLVLLVGLGALGCALWFAANPPPGMGWFHAFLCFGWGALWRGALIALGVTIVLAIVTYTTLRKQEATDAVDARMPDRAVNAQIFARENHYRQNHMISITQRKPGWVRAFTARAFFWFLSQVIGKAYPPGYLGSIGTIHFARWVTVPGTRDLVFLSNYAGSWESYLEDFITRAHEGLTGVWSNSVGFPRSNNLIQDGATDSERFKHYARRSMIPTRFWYSAYPQHTTQAIRANAEIRRGLSGALTEDEASNWLALFGSAVRPPSKLVSSEIQSLVFGGLGFLKHGTTLVFDSLPSDVAKARQWLDGIRPDIAFNDGRRLGKDRTAVLTLGLGPGGLARLGLRDTELESFPFAFVEGMCGAGRSRILGDDETTLEWGKRPPDVVLLVYGEHAGAVRRLKASVIKRATAAGMPAPYEVPLETVTDNKAEPFGFVDGISQPVIRGTYKGMRNADPIHLVEPGEFILGYPDNRGNTPPGPTLAAWRDPANLLPLVDPLPGFDQNQVEHDRDLGFNGTFLVIRELEQEVDAFWDYCEKEAKIVDADGRLPAPYHVTKEFIGAKLVGRWPDGSSLTRYPYQQRTKEKQAAPTHETVRAEGASFGGSTVSTAPKPPSRLPGDNDFLHGAEDPEALRCPFGAHIRRSNPRDSLMPGSADEITITNRHRIIRVGRPYAKRRGIKPGILFMCLNGDIERQFEFIQQTWLHNPAFHGLTCEKDPLLGDGEEGNCSFTIPSRSGPVQLSPMRSFVNTRGGGYFFLPGKRLIEYLSSAP